MRRIYIWQKDEFPSFKWNAEELSFSLGNVRNLQGRLIGIMSQFGFDIQLESVWDNMSESIIKSSEIEGVYLDTDQVRSLVARHLGLERYGLPPKDRDIEGVVQVMMDATMKYNEPLTADRLFGWHHALFPSGYSGMHKVTVGEWRQDEGGPMQVVSGVMGKEKIHYEAPPSSEVPMLMKSFISWFNEEQKLDTVIKSAIAHLWFLTVHPFDDGNGRIARTLSDMLMVRSDGMSQRFYSISSMINAEKKSYYEILEKTQKGDLDITEWLLFYLNCLCLALEDAELKVRKVIAKANFWKKVDETSVNERQKKILNMLHDGFTGNLTSSKWAKINKCSPDTALRDIQDLMNKNILYKTESGGRSTSYILVDPVKED